ncbi:hypothetical protein MKW98_005941, partial [Papaver atlanticum]
VMALLPKPPLQPQLLQTVCLAIGAYSQLLDASLNGLLVLLSVIEILMSGMSASEDSAAAAALAFWHICDARNHLKLFYVGSCIICHRCINQFIS